MSKGTRVARLDVEWALSEIDAFLHLTEQVVSDVPGVIGIWMRGPETDAAGRAHVVEQILDRVPALSAQDQRGDAGKARPGRRVRVQAVQRGLTLKVPAAGANRLRLMKDDGSDTYKSVHEGARAFAEGLYRAIRNPGMHTPPPANGGEVQIALERLAAFSILARWVSKRTSRPSEPGSTEGE
jgi:hypothetical protein